MFLMGFFLALPTSHQKLRRMLVEDQKLDGVVSMPAGVFKPYSGVSTGDLCCLRRPTLAAPNHVWFYDLDADGYSLDDKRTPLLRR